MSLGLALHKECGEMGGNEDHMTASGNKFVARRDFPHHFAPREADKQSRDSDTSATPEAPWASCFIIGDYAYSN